MNHVGLVSSRGYILPCAQPTWVDPPNLKPAKVIEALGTTVESPWHPRQKPGNEVSVWRYKDITCQQAWVANYRARQFVGSRYGWWKLAAHLIDNKAFDGRVVTRHLLRVDSRPICSYVVATALACASIRTGNIPARAQSPDTMWDYVNASDRWYEVGRGFTQKEVA
jgi:hypothetical protein